MATPESVGGRLLSLFKQEAENRGFLNHGDELPVSRLFSLVRDMPYQRASTREPEAAIREWRGTCSVKHYLLKSLFEDAGFEARVMMCTHHFNQENTSHLPEALRAHVSAGPVPDVHTFVRLKLKSGWMDVDATWPLETSWLGMPVNEQFVTGVDMTIACDPVEFFEVPKGMDPQSFKEQLIESHCGVHMQRRDRFIEDMSSWLMEAVVR